MDGDNTSQDKGKGKVVESTEPRKVNILQLAQWLTVATSNNKGFLLKPNDLRMLYLLVLWDHISEKFEGNNYTEVPTIANDEEISISEEKLVRMVQLVFHNTYYPYFHRVFNM